MDRTETKGCLFSVPRCIRWNQFLKGKAQGIGDDDQGRELGDRGASGAGGQSAGKCHFFYHLFQWSDIGPAPQNTQVLLG